MLGQNPQCGRVGGTDIVSIVVCVNISALEMETTQRRRYVGRSWEWKMSKASKASMGLDDGFFGA